MPGDPTVWVVMTGFFNSTALQFVDHPACSPDLNLIDNFWGWMAREVSKDGHQFQTVGSLHEAIFTTWSNIPTSLLETLIQHAETNF